MESKINISDIGFCFQDYPDNSPEGAFVVYMSGCSHNCEECHNYKLADPNYGEEISVNDLEDKLSKRSKRFNGCNRVVLMGGDPFFKNNVEFTLQFLKQTKFKVCIYTGYTLSELKDMEVLYKIKGNFDYLKTGRYKKSEKCFSEKTATYFQLASTNQKLYDSELNLLTNNGRMTLEEYI